MIAHKVTIDLPESRALVVELPDEFAVGPVEVIVLGREAIAERTPRESSPLPPEISVEDFRRVFPRIAELSDGMQLHEDVTLPLDAEQWGDLAS